MTVTLKVFAGLAEVFQTNQLELKLSPPVRLRDVRDELAMRYPDEKVNIIQALFAVNQVYAPLETTVQEGDEVAIIPPVGGGDQPASCRISDTPLSMEEAYGVLADVHNGGTVLFCGTVREFTNQRQTLFLTYQAYTEMALTQMREIEAEIQQQFPQAHLLQWHRVGTLYPGETAVICGASSPHRNDAFEAARLLIERLKREVPIWKKEHYADGEASWQPNEQG